MKKNFVSNSSESVRMFKSNFLESVSKVNFYVPLLVYIPVILYLGWDSLFDRENGYLKFYRYMLLGLFIWSFTEYILHRFVFHFYPKGRNAAQNSFYFSWGAS